MSLMWFYTIGADGRQLAPRLLLWGLRRFYALSALPEIAREPDGKPFFPQYPGLHFNLSHSGPYALCAFGDTPLGADIELVRPRKEGLAQKILSPAELAQWHACPDPTGRLIAHWVLKESYCKYTGEGLRLSPRSSEFLALSTGVPVSNRADSRFYLVETAAFCAALCTKSPAPPDALRLIAEDSL